MATPWVATLPNVIPVDDPATGGLARFYGWYTELFTVAANNGDGTLTITPTHTVTSSNLAGGVALPKIPATPGDPVGAAVEVNGSAQLQILWVYTGGATSIAASNSVGSGGGRIVVITGAAPANVIGLVLKLYVGGAAVTFSHPAVVPFASDPGQLDPTQPRALRGDALYAYLPHYLRVDDIPTGFTLRSFLRGLGVMVDDMQVIADQLDDGLLTDPANVPSAWLPWLARVVGVPVTDDVTTRSRLVSRSGAAGSRGSIGLAAQVYLTGTKQVSVNPGTGSPWEISVRVLASEITAAAPVNSTTAGLAAAIMATRRVPAGHYITCTTALTTWALMEAAHTTWGTQLEGNNWAQVESTGL